MGGSNGVIGILAIAILATYIVIAISNGDDNDDAISA